MKKAYLFFVCSVALFNYGYTQWNDDGNFKCWTEDLLYKAGNLKSKVKSITAFGYNLEKLSGGVEQKKLFGKATYCYDSLGNRTKELYYEPNGDLSVYNILKYNEDGYIIEKSTFSGYASGGFSGGMHVISNKYDTKNNLVENSLSSVVSGSKTYNNSFIYKYDSNGNIIEKTESSYADGKLGGNRNYNYRYNPKGNLVETLIFLNGVLEKKEFFKYDLKSRPLELIQYDTYGKPLLRFIHKYDTKDKLVEEIEYQYGVVKRRIFFKYDNKNNIIKTIIIYYGIKYPLQNVEYEYEFYK